LNIKKKYFLYALEKKCNDIILLSYLSTIKKKKLYESKKKKKKKDNFNLIEISFPLIIGLLFNKKIKDNTKIY